MENSMQEKYINYTHTTKSDHSVHENHEHSCHQTHSNRENKDIKFNEHHDHPVHHKYHKNTDHHHHHDHHEKMVSDFKNRFWISVALTIPILGLSPLIQKIFNIEFISDFKWTLYLLFLFSSVVYVYGGFPFLKGLYHELRNKKPGMMTLIALAITTAYIYSGAVILGLRGRIFFWELVTLIDIMLLGHWIEMRSVMRASKALEELAKLLPSKAHKVVDGDIYIDIPIEDLQKGDRVLVKPGEKIPADGIVVKGVSYVDESMITGESLPVLRKEGEEVIGGSINGDGSIIVEIKKVGEESFLSQVIKLVKDAQSSKSKNQSIADKAALWLTLISLTVGATTFVVWYYIINKEFVFALERAITVMVITCPHALGLAIPLVVAVSTTISARNGLLIKNRIPFESAFRVKAVIFDKTGTLTEGKFGVSDILLVNDSISKDKLLQYAASVEVNSEHPIGKGIVEAARQRSVALRDVKNFKAFPGKGASGSIDDKNVEIKSPNYLEQEDFKYNKKLTEMMNRLLKEKKTTVVVLLNKEIAGFIGLEDRIREEARSAVNNLKRMGITCIMITGDNYEVAGKVADELGIDEYFAGVLPSDKAKKVREVKNRGIKVAMVGDGINDAPALAEADVGIAIGAGTDVAVETADIVLVKNNPLDIITILNLSRSTYVKMIQNLIWATGYNAFAIPLAAGVLAWAGIVLGPATGAILMSISTVIVAINARLLRITRPD